MHKGLYSALWVLFFTLITACNPKPDPKPDPIPEPPSEISVTGKIMLGPVVRGHSLKLVIYDADMKELDRPKVALDGSYGFKLKDYKGVIIAQVTSENPDQCSGDYIDEATAKPKCLGKSTILSSTYVQSGTSDNQAKLHTTPVTTVAVLHAGVVLDDNGGLTVPKGLTQDRIIQSNKAVAKVFGLGDQSIAEYTPTSIITTDQKFKTGDAYTKALAAISGVEAIDNTKNLNNILKQISSAISTDTKNPALNPALQDTMVKGLQKVAEKIKANSGEKTILKNLSEYQDKFPKSIVAVDLTKTLPEPPSFTDETKTKTTILKPTWHWKPDNTGNTKYQYRVGEADRTWKDIAKNKFTPSENLKRGKHTLIIRQANVNKATLWSKPTQLTIEIVPNTKGDVSITGTPEQHQTLVAKVSDMDGIADDKVSYQWYRDNQLIIGETNNRYLLTHKDVNKKIKISATYTDNHDSKESPQFITDKIKDINDSPIVEIDKNSCLLAEESKLFQCAIKVSDLDGTKDHSFNLLKKPDDMIITSTGLITWTPPNKNKSWSEIIEIKIDDGSRSNNAVLIKQFTIDVVSSDDDPVLEIDNVEIFEDSAEKRVTLSATDIDNDNENIRYQFIESNNPDIADIRISEENNNELIIRPITDKNGSATVIVSATSNKKTVRKSFNLTIKSVDDDPVLEIDNVEIFEDSAEKRVTLSATDIDNDNENIRYQFIESNNPDIANIRVSEENNNELIIRPITDKNGSATVIVSATSNKKTVRKSFNLTIKNVDDDPVLNLTEFVTVKEDSEPWGVTFSVTDIDSPLDDITITSTTSNLASITFIEDVTSGDTKNFNMIMRPLQDKFGNEEVTITAESGEGKATGTFTLFIQGVNDAPFFSKKISDVKIDEDSEGLNYDISVIDIDTPVRDIELLTVASDLASIEFKEVSASGNTKNFNMNVKPIKNKFGRDTITITAKSGGQITTDTFNIDIIPTHVKSRKISSQIDVCWKQITDASSNIYIPANPSQSAENNKHYIEETINNSWGKNTAINFKWYNKDECPDDERTLKISFTETEDDALKDKQAIYLPYSHAIIFHPTVKKRRTIIHEFGHALGFPDEHARLDVYRGGSYEQADNGKVCTQIVNGTPILAEDHTYHGKERKDKGLKVVSMADWQKQPYNPFSVMNDCTSAIDYKDKFIDEDKKIFLSDDDIKRAQQFYGAPLEANQTEHLMKDGDMFFTGLQKREGEDNYDFYEYGVKNYTYNINEIVSNINDYQDGDYLNISKKPEYQETKSISDNEILFQYSKEQYLTPQDHALIVCIGSAAKINYFGANKCLNQSMMTASSSENYDIYYNDFYGRKNEFNIMLCEKREDIDISNTTYKFVKINNDRCIDNVYSNFISSYPRISQYFSKKYLSDNLISTETLPIYKTFIKGKGMSGFLTQDVDIKLQDNKFIFPDDYLEVDNEKNYIRYVSDKLPLTGFISKDFSMFFKKPFPFQSFDLAFLLRLGKLAKMKPGYYVNGVHTDRHEYKDESILWFNSDQEITIVQKNIYAFVDTEGDGKETLYKNGELFNGIYKNNDYTDGVLEQ